MKIGFIGTGALGGYYAARLAHAGEEVHCLCRSDYDVVSQEGLRVKSFEGDFAALTQRPEANCRSLLVLA